MTGNFPPPSAEAQLEFLQKVQRLLEEGQFVASYKFALLHALADLAVLRGNDTGDQLPLATSTIAERVVELYWTQTRPFPGRKASEVLRQNTGGRAKIVSLIEGFQQQHGASLGSVRRQDMAWRGLVREVRIVVEKMPLWRLQMVGRSPLEFLYRNEGKGDQVVLLPGVAFCLRRFHGLVVELARSAWVRYVRASNGDLLGDATELDEFLFGAERTDLAIYRRILAEPQQGKCFYCHGSLGSVAEVDHFIPWALYPTDLGHNFVLACRGCNADKSDRLAAYPHLENWWRRNEERGTDLALEFGRAQVPFQRDSSDRIVSWAYRRLEMSAGLCWWRDRPKEERMVGLAPEWRGLLGKQEPGKMLRVAEGEAS